jgi:hypothetical protein
VSRPRADWKIKRLELIFKNGKKVEADLVMRDDAMGIAFVAPKKRGVTFTHVHLAKVPLPDVMDDTIVTRRLNEDYDYETSVFIAPVTAVMKRKQSFLLSGVDDTAIVFDTKGRFIGLSGTRWFEAEGGKYGLPWIMMHDALQPAIEKAARKWKEAAK